MITPSQIKERSLSTVQSGGYDKEEVNDLLLEVIESYEAVYEENKELYRKMEILANKIEDYRGEEDSIKTALITAQKMADKVTKDAKAESEKILIQTKATADKTMSDAKASSDKMIADAKEYSANYTAEKTATADKALSDAQAQAAETIENSKVTAQNVLNQARELSDDLVNKAKIEKRYHEDLIARLQGEIESFKTTTINLYENQINKLNALVDFTPDLDFNDRKIKNVEAQMDDIISDIDEINKIAAEKEQIADDEVADDEVEAIDEFETDDIDEVEETEESFGDEDDEITEFEDADDSDDASDDIEIDEIIDDIESNDTYEDEDEEVYPNAVNNAIDAFSADEITPLGDDAGAFLSEIEEEPEMETIEPIDDEEPRMSFEDFFNVPSEEHRTNETISLIPPDDDDDDDDDDEPSKVKGFFKRKNK